MSFESRFADVGRFLDEMVDALRDRASRAGPAIDTRAIKDAVTDRVSRAYDSTRHAVADHGTRLSTTENRSRLGMAALIIACIALTAFVTSQFTGGPGPSAVPDAEAQLLRSIAAERDAKRGNAAPLQPVRAAPASKQPRVVAPR